MTRPCSATPPQIAVLACSEPEPRAVWFPSENLVVAVVRSDYQRTDLLSLGFVDPDRILQTPVHIHEFVQCLKRFRK